MTQFTLLIVMITFVFGISVSAQPDNVDISVTGIGADVTIRRDARAIPYIEASNDDDLYFTQGYVTAGDRLWQMDLMRRLARGETAEIFGKAALEQDQRWRRFDFAGIADANLEFLSPDLRRALESYARGVNAYIATLTDENIPVEFRILQYRPSPWRPSDTIVIGKILSDALSTTWRNDLMRASVQGFDKDKLLDLNNPVTPYDVILFGSDKQTGPKVSPQRAAVDVSPTLLAAADHDEMIRRSSLEQVGLYAEQLAASNNWVIAGDRTASGKPILANDPHLTPATPGIWYLTHLSSPSTRVSGVTFPGVPGIILGHNENIAWGATNVGPDVQDLYIETFDGAGKYKTPSGWETPVMRKEIIKVRSNPLKTETESVTFEVTVTRNGPVITEDGSKKYALRWTALDPHNSEFETFYRWNRAKDWTEFKGALANYGGAAQNFVYADVKGNIGWYAASRIPIRRTGDGSLPYDGSTNDGDWIGSIPFSELPNLYNPPSGLIVTANQRIVGTSYKYSQLSRDTAAPWRARRIYDALSSKKKITMDDVRDVQHDAHNIPLSNLAQEIVKRRAASPETIEILKSWDGNMTQASQGAVLANEIRDCIGAKVAASNQPIPAFIIRERILDWAIREDVIRWLPEGAKGFGEVIRSCDTYVRLELADAKRLGPDASNWTWGRVWRSRFPHPLSGVPLIGGQFSIPAVSLDGSGQSPNVGSAVSMRLITSPGEWDSTRHVIPLGQSGNPSSPHFKDQFSAWSTGTPTLFPFSRSAVEKASAGSPITVLRPLRPDR